MANCNCGNVYNVGMGCCEPVLGPIENYYTKYQVDKLISGITVSGVTEEEMNEAISAATDGLASEEYVNNQISYQTADFVTSGQLSSYTYDKAAIDSKLAEKLDVSAYTPVDLSNYVTKAELNQNILNLQTQINSLLAAVSGCCGETGETRYRWITMTGENDYWCSGTTKMSKEKEQSSNDGIIWTDAGNIRSGSTVLEENCTDCGYFGGSILQITYYSETPPTKIANICSQDVEKVGIASLPNPVIFNNCITTVNSALTSGNTVSTYKSTTIVENEEYADTDMWRGSVSSEMTSIGNGAFSGNTILSSFTIGNYSRIEPYNQNPNSKLTSIGDYAFKNCSSLNNLQISHCRNTVPTLGTGVFDGCSSLQAIYVDNSMVNAFKTAPGWSDYASIIQGI